MDDSPLSILMKEFLPHEQVSSIENEVAKIEDLPRVQKLAGLTTPDYGNDPTELIRNRFLYRGGVCLLLGPTGVGKSAFSMQFGIHLAIGKGLFGIEPGEIYRGNGMRILLVQSENDEGDLAEMRDGVLAGCEDLTEDDKLRALEQFAVCTINDLSAERFTEMLAALFDRHGPLDLVIGDPAFAYLGGDSNSQRDVSHFMRALVNPLLQQHQIGMILSHHTNKPLRGKEKESWAAGDYAYLGSGSAEWINAARAALAIRSLGSDTVFELRAAKRGHRLRWKDADGQPTMKRYIAHHGDPGVICWREATEDEVEEVLSSSKGGRPPKLDPVEVLHCVRRDPGRNQTYYKQKISSVVGCSVSTVQNAIKKCLMSGWLRFAFHGGENLYSTTEKGDKMAGQRPSAYDW